MVEKPAGVYVSQIRKMNEEAEKHPDVKFAMMFNQRTNPLYLEGKRDPGCRNHWKSAPCQLDHNKLVENTEIL